MIWGWGCLAQLREGGGGSDLFILEGLGVILTPKESRISMSGKKFGRASLLEGEGRIWKVGGGGVIPSREVLAAAGAAGLVGRQT
jgi:hypothetical protein